MAKKKKKDNSKILATTFMIFTALIMVSGTIGFLYSGPENPTNIAEYEAFELEQVGYQWQIKNTDIMLNYLPDQVQDIEIDMASHQIIASATQMYMSFDPNSIYLESIDTFRFDLGTHLFYTGKTIIPAIMENSTDYQFETINCFSENLTIPVLEIKKGNETRIIAKSPTCINIEFRNAQELTALHDKLIYQLLGAYQNGN